MPNAATPPRATLTALFTAAAPKLRAMLTAMLLVLAATAARAQTPRYHGDGIDDYLRFVPLASAFALKASGVESASSWRRLTVNTAVGMGLTCGVTLALKHTVHDTRPDRTDNRAFPSGHTAIAFAGARILDKEFRHTSPWISVAGYAVATATAIDRVRRNRHRWDDVACGAAVGLLSTEAAYWLGDKLTGERSRWHVAADGQTLSLVVEL